MLPLLREQEGSGGQSQTSTAEERVIGAGLKAIEKNKDGAAVKELFHMFAVTQEDFVHPVAVIELLWRACCASEAEKQEGSLTTRLKVRQWTQMLADHSLLLGSSTEGIHLVGAKYCIYTPARQRTHTVAVAVAVAVAINQLITIAVRIYQPAANSFVILAL